MTSRTEWLIVFLIAAAIIGAAYFTDGGGCYDPQLDQRIECPR